MQKKFKKKKKKKKNHQFIEGEVGNLLASLSLVKLSSSPLSPQPDLQRCEFPQALFSLLSYE